MDLIKSPVGLQLQPTPNGTSPHLALEVLLSGRKGVTEVLIMF